MALGSDPYAVLGVPRDATDAQIAQARRRLSREYHPDLNPAPDAAACFDEVQQAFHLLSAARPEYDRARDEQGRTRVTRDHGGGYRFATEASPGIFIQPTSVDFGLLTPKQPRADAEVSVAWTGTAPTRMEMTQGSDWWASLGSEQPTTSCVVFFLRAHAHAGTRSGRRKAQFTVIVHGTTLTVQLTAEIQGEFPPGSRPDFTPRPQPGTDEGRGPGIPEDPIPGHLHPWIVVIIALLFIMLLIVIRG